MSDLLRDLRKQPVRIPILGGEDTTYDAPLTAWDGEPVRVEMVEGEEAQGFVPGTRITPETHNHVSGTIGEAVASIVDSAATTWSSPLKSFSASIDFSGMGNGLFCGPITAPAQWYNGTDMGAEVLCAVNASGLYMSLDGWEWVLQGAIGFASQATVLAAGHLEVLGSHYVRLVAYSDESGGYEFRYSDDLGAAWSDGGVSPGAVNAGGRQMGFFNEIFFLAAEGQVFFSSDLPADDPWEESDVTGFWDTGEPTCVAVNETEALIGIDAEPYVAKSTDAETWVDGSSGLTGTAGVTHLAWSESHGLWLMLRDDGSFWTAPAGVASWAQRTAPTHSLGLEEVIPAPFTCLGVHGRTVIIGSGKFLWASRDLTRWARMIPRAHEGSVETWQWILPFNGALWAAHLSTQANETGVTFEHSLSGVLAPELARVVPW